MLHVWMEENMLLYGMIGSGILGVLCLLAMNHFYNGAIRDLRRIEEPKGKWTRKFLEEYRARSSKEQEIHNPEAFIRTQMSSGKVFGISMQKWKQGIGYGALLCFAFLMAAVYETYRYQDPEMVRYQYVLAGAGILALILLGRQILGFSEKEETVLDGLVDYMENTSSAPVNTMEIEAVKAQAREEIIDRVKEGIQQTAASETKFSHMLTPEEEHIMREVIREYLA